MTTTKLKIKVTKAQMLEVLAYYTNNLAKHFCNELASRSTVYKAQALLAELKQRGRMFSTNPAWDVEVTVNSVNSGAGLEVSILDPSSVLYLDFDS